MKMKAAIKQDTLFQKLKRHLLKHDSVLHKARPKYRHDLGEYYTTDLMTNVIELRDINLELFARAEGLLKH